MAKAASWTAADAEARKPGERTGLDTPVVLAVLKLKGIDGGPHKRWSMWFNSTQREEPYQGLTLSERHGNMSPSSEARKQVVHGCRQLVP